MSFHNDEPFLMAVGLVHKGTFIIGVYMQECKKNYILDQLTKLIIKLKYAKTNIWVFGDFNTNAD